AREVVGHGVDVVGQVLPRAGNAAHHGLAAQLAVRPDFARDARDFGGERVQLVDHGVDGVLQLEHVGLHVHRDLLGQVTARHGRRHFGDVAHLRREVAGHEVHGVGQVLPRTRAARHLRLAPSLPSVPTSRATRVTSEAKPFSWSTIVLMVFFSSSTSPRTSTVIFCERSPLATAVVTFAMLRTWPVSVWALRCALSVRSFHVPAMPDTCAWPPSLPSVPTSRATRVTSDANAFSWSTIVLMVSFSSRISPFTSTVILRERSPRATAVVTVAMLRTCV